MLLQQLKDAGNLKYLIGDYNSIQVRLECVLVGFFVFFFCFIQYG